MPPRLTFAFELRARVGNPIEVGQVTHGRRRIVPIEGGTVKGPQLNGIIPPGGADWQTIQADGFTELDTRYTIQTDKDQLVYVQNPGIRTAAPDVMQKLLAGEAVFGAFGWVFLVPGLPQIVKSAGAQFLLLDLVPGTERPRSDGMSES